MGLSNNTRLVLFLDVLFSDVLFSFDLFPYVINVYLEPLAKP